MSHTVPTKDGHEYTVRDWDERDALAAEVWLLYRVRSLSLGQIGHLKGLSRSSVWDLVKIGDRNMDREVLPGTATALAEILWHSGRERQTQRWLLYAQAQEPEDKRRILDSILEEEAHMLKTAQSLGIVHQEAVKHDHRISWDGASDEELVARLRHPATQIN